MSRYGCFTADTPVLMADGTAKPIGQVAVGERVVSHDPVTGEDVEAEVEATHVHHDVPTLEVTTTAGTITTTSTHPFYVQGRGWTPAADLRRGDRLKTPHTTTNPDHTNNNGPDANTTGADAVPAGDGQAVAVLTIQPTGRTTTVHNLTIRNTHNYHVLTTPTTNTTGPDTNHTTTPTPILVHNNGDACGEVFESRSAAFRAAKRDANVPMSEQPSYVNHDAKMTDKWERSVLDERGNTIYTIEYHFTGPGHEPVVIQNHAAGHTFGPPGTKGNHGPHYNVRPYEKGSTIDPDRNGHIRGCRTYYGWGNRSGA